MKTKWLALMQALDFDPNEDEYEKILNYYSEQHRAYHNLSHIADCLKKCEFNQYTKSNIDLQLAIWYHDVIYRSFKKDNESKSAEQAETFLLNQSFDKDRIDHIKDIIMSTLHTNPPSNEDEAYMMDIDISILGSSLSAYSTYSKNIRMEYKLIPGFIYKRKRIEVLKMFLNKKNLFHTSYFKSKYETTARINIEIELEQLEQGKKVFL